MFGTSRIKSHDPGSGVLEHFLWRESKPFLDHAGKVVLRGGQWLKGAVERAGDNDLAFWHHCALWGDDHEVVRFAPNSIRINHYSLKYGERSLEHRSQRGTEGYFSGQAMYKALKISDLDHRNDVRDDMFAISQESFPRPYSRTSGSRSIRKRVEPVCPICINSRGEGLSQVTLTRQVHKISTPFYVMLHTIVDMEWRHIIMDMLLTMESSGILLESRG